MRKTNDTFSNQIDDLLYLTKIGSWDWNVSTGHVVYSPIWAELLGYTLEELPQTVETWENIMFPEDLPYAHAKIQRHFSGEDAVYEAEFRMVCKDGSVIWVQDKGHVSEVDENQKPLRFIGVMQNISDIKNVELRLMENQETLDLAINVAGLGTWDWDILKEKVTYNDTYLQMLGYTKEDMNNSVEEWKNLVHPEDIAPTTEMICSYVAENTQIYERELRMRHKDGTYIWMRHVGRIVARDDNGKATRIIGGQLNIDDIKRTQERLNKLAYFDEYTGLPNLTKFRHDAKHLLHTYRHKTFVFVKIDIINFKIINDIFGTLIGDMVISKMAKLIQRVQMQKQVEHNLLARVHDDVFILVDEYLGESKEEADKRCRMFEDLFNTEMRLILGNHKVQFRYGRYFPPKGDMDVDYAIECTTLALSKAKTIKGTNLFDFDIDVKIQMRKEVELANKMQTAMEHNEFVVYLQGKYSLIDESLCGAESLARWKVADDTVISPAEFIPVFEQNGTITKLDMFMFTQCCAILADWRAQGLALIPISVNFSRKHLENPNFAKDLADIAKSYDIDPSYLEIELTETIVMDAGNDLSAFISALHGYGFQVSMDDFGTGYSSLGMLKNLEIDTIKLDRSFFVEAQENIKAHAVLSNMLNMTIDLGIKTVAEGVEEKSHVELLRKLNCDVIQGYFFGRPIPVSDFTKKIFREVNTETLLSVNDKQKRFNLRKNNELLMDMMNSMPLAFTLWNKDLSIVQCNKEAANMVGFKNEEEMITRMLEIIPEFQPDGTESFPTIAHRIQLAFEHGYGRYSPWYFHHINGTPLPCEVILVRIVNKGEFMIASYVRDISVQMEAENSIKHEYSKLQSLLDAMPMCVGLWDKDMKLSMCNSVSVSLFGLDSKADYLENFYGLSPKKQPNGKHSATLAAAYLNQAFTTGRANFHWMHRKKDGTPLPAEITLVRLTFDDAPLVAGFTRDMRQQLLEEEHSNRVLSNVLNHMSSMIYIIDLETYEILYENESILSYTGEPTVGTLCYESFRGETKPCFNCPLNDLSHENKYTSVEFYNRKFDFYGKAMGSYIQWVNGKKCGLVNITDVSEYKDLLDASPLFIYVLDKNEKLIMCNKAVTSLFGLKNEQMFLENFPLFSPEVQPDGKNSLQSMDRNFKEAMAKGSKDFFWMHQTLDGVPLPTEVHLARISLNGSPVLGAFVRDLREK